MKKIGIFAVSLAFLSLQLVCAQDFGEGFARRLGGGKLGDYGDATGLLGSKQHSSQYKSLIARHNYKSYEKAYQNLPDLPLPYELDTREKMAYYVNDVCESYNQANLQTEPRVTPTPVKTVVEAPPPKPRSTGPVTSPAKQELEKQEKVLKAKLAATDDPKIQTLIKKDLAIISEKIAKEDYLIKQKLAKEEALVQTKIEKVAATRLPDPNAEAYAAIVKPIVLALKSESAEARDLVTVRDALDADEGRWLGWTGGIRRSVYKDISAFAKESSRGWYTSDECREVQKIEDRLMQLARRERPTTMPQWFVDGRKGQADIIREYNRKILARFESVIEPRLREKRAQIKTMLDIDAKLKAYYRPGDISQEYADAKNSTSEAVQAAFQSYYYMLSCVGLVPLVRTPTVPEVGQKFSFKY